MGGTEEGEGGERVQKRRWEQNVGRFEKIRTWDLGIGHTVDTGLWVHLSCVHFDLSPRVLIMGKAKQNVRNGCKAEGCL